MQPYFFPYIGYFQLINCVNKYVIYDNVNFSKHSWVNRNRLIDKNKGEALITMPLVKQSHNSKIWEVTIDDNQPWRKKLLKNIETNYRRASQYEVVLPLLSSIINYKTSKLSEFNKNSIVEICKYLHIDTEIIANKKYEELESDLLTINPVTEQELVKVKRIVGVCKTEKFNVYVNAIGGADIYNKNDFSANGIDILFLKPNNIVYNQFVKPFIPWLSIIDVIMFNKKADVNKMLNDYSLI